MKNRTNQILEMLAKEKKIEVADLSQRLGVSTVTVRKDLDDLESRGIVKREHGFAVLGNENDVASRIAYHYEAKRKIAKKAAELVSDGDTVMIESGSCCALLAFELAETKRDITIVTNSAFIAGYVREMPGVLVVLLGGIYQPDSQVMVGPLVSQCAKNFFVKSLFIGVDGWSEHTGFTNRDQLRAQAVQDMANQAEQILVLTESEKFSKHGVVPLGINDKPVTVITDKALSFEPRTFLESQGNKIVYCSP